MVSSLFSTLYQSLWVCLPTDLLLWSLAWMLAGGVVIIVRSPIQQALWRRVFRQRLAVFSAVLLTVAGGFALLDSIHFRAPLPVPAGQTAQGPRYSVEVQSVLDLLLADLRQPLEKTYSAPLAVDLAAQEPVTVTLPDGSVVVQRAAPRLKVIGEAFPAGPVSTWAHVSDVLVQGGQGLVIGVIWALALGLLWIVFRRAVFGATAGDWLAWSRTERRVGCSVMILFVAGGVLTGLSAHYHAFGTDKVGQDVLYQVLKSLRTAMVIGLVPTLVTLPLGVVLGLSAGYFRGRVDDVIQYLYTTVSAIPGVLLIAASVLSIQVMIDTHPHWFATAVERGDVRLLALCVILGMTSWTGIARLLRGEALRMREYDYVVAAQAFGVSAGRILARHILPNVFPMILMTLVMEFSTLVLAEAVLSYIGIGVDPSMFSFGLMINNARMELSREPVVWWSLTAAFLFMVLLVLAANLLADAVRDALDPRAEGR